MGDLVRCPKCATHHYRNDPCPDRRRTSHSGRKLHPGKDIKERCGYHDERRVRCRLADGHQGACRFNE